jgi:cobalamin biosynthesis protein CobD/CbiB
MESCAYCNRRRTEGFRGLLALVVVLLTFGIAYYRLYLGRETETLVPTWAGVLVGSVVSTYFMARSGEVMRRITQEGNQQRADRATAARETDTPNNGESEERRL